MTVQLGHLVRGVLRFLWIGALFVLGAAALASLLLIPFSFITPFSASTGVSHEVMPPLPTGNQLSSRYSITLICGSGGARIAITAQHRAPDVVTDPLEFYTELWPRPVGYPAALDDAPPNAIGPSWLGAYWSYSSRPGFHWHSWERSGYVGVVAPLPLIAVACALLPALRVRCWRRRRKGAGRGFPVMPAEPWADG